MRKETASRPIVREDSSSSSRRIVRLFKNISDVKFKYNSLKKDFEQHKLQCAMVAEEKNHIPGFGLDRLPESSSSYNVGLNRLRTMLSGTLARWDDTFSKSMTRYDSILDQLSRITPGRLEELQSQLARLSDSCGGVAYSIASNLSVLRRTELRLAKAEDLFDEVMTLLNRTRDRNLQSHDRLDADPNSELRTWLFLPYHGGPGSYNPPP